MKIMRLLEIKTGAMWTGIIFHQGNSLDSTLCSKPMRLCEAIHESYVNQVSLTPGQIDCPGACRSLSIGWSNNRDNELAQKISKKSGIPQDLAHQVISHTPRLVEPITALSIGKIENPDVLLSYLQPNAAMKFVRWWQNLYGTNLSISISSFMAVCGNVAVKAYMLGQICLSFGCPDSRKHGRMESDKLIIGIPYFLAKKLFQEDYYHAYV